MKQTIIIFLARLSLGFGVAQAQSPELVVHEAETHSVFKGFFVKVWSKLRAINPPARGNARSHVVYTAGIRGAEATETLIQPYWKGDLSTDAAFQAELKAYSSAQQLLDDGVLDQSVTAFNDFLQQHASSTLAPNALFARSLGYAALGKSADARFGLQTFIDKNPQHPLAADAVELIAQLK